MNEKLDEILTAYEDLWRQAALKGMGQLCVASGGEWGGCASLIPIYIGRQALFRECLYSLQWTCPEDGRRERFLGGVMIHLNNVHHWPWDRLANKFRDALAEGLAK